MPPQPHDTVVTLGVSLVISEPQFLHLQNTALD